MLKRQLRPVLALALLMLLTSAWAPAARPSPAAGGHLTGAASAASLVPAALTGVARQPGGSSPLSGGHAMARALTPNLPLQPMGGPISASGNFTVTNVIGGAVYQIVAVPAPDSGFTASFPITATFSGGVQSVGNLDVTTPQLTGVVTRSGTAFAGAAVMLGADGPSSLTIPQTFISSGAGQFVFGGLPDGGYMLKANAPPLLAPPPVRVIVNGGSVVQVGDQPYAPPVQIALAEPAFTGTVVAPDGSTPAGGGNVELRGVGSAVMAGSGVGGDGRFGFGSLPDGIYALRAFPPPPQPGSAPLFPSLPLQIELRAGQISSVGGQPFGGTLVLRLTSGQVVGTVVAPDGTTPVGDAQVEVRDSANGFFIGARTDPVGHFALGGLPDGAYAIHANPHYGGAAPFFRSPPLPIEIRGGQLAAVGGQPPSGPLILRLTLAQLTGTVFAPDGTTPISQTVVELRRPDMSFFLSVPSDGSGRFAFGGIPSGTYELQARAPRDNPDRYGDSPVQSVLIGAGAPASAALRLTRPQVVGLVRAPDGGGGFVPVPGVGVGLIKTADAPPAAKANSDPSGHFLFGGLPPGTYQVVAWLPPGLPYTPPAPQSITLVADAAPHALTITLGAPTKTISGRVTLNGGGVTNAVVFANQDERGQHASAPTDASGNYRLTLPGGGAWKVGVAPARDSSPPADWVFTQPPALVTFTLPDSQPEQIANVNFAVTGAGATVAGRVLTKDNLPPPFGTVFVEVRDSSGRGNGAQLNHDGSYAIRVPPGRYQVRVFVKDALFGPESAPPLVEALEGQTASVPTIFLVKRALTISGQVIIHGSGDTGGSPVGVAGVKVVAFRVGGGEFIRSESLEGGVFTLYVTPGDWELQAFPEPDSGFVPGTPARLRVGSESVKDVHLALLTAGGLINGRLTSSDNSVDPSRLYGFAYALDAQHRQVAGAPVEGGRFTLRVPRGALYTVGVNFPPGYSFGVAPAAADLRSAAEASLELPVQVASATVVGAFVDPAGQPVPGLDAEAFAFGELGFRGARVGQNGNFSLSLLPGQWSLGGRLGPDSQARYWLRPPTDRRVTLGDGETLVLRPDQRFVVVSADGAISGVVRDPAGQPLLGARVWAELPPVAGAPPRFAAGTVSAHDGAYTIRVPAGRYVVRAAAAPELGYMPPPPADAVLATTPQTVTVNLQFRAVARQITGRVLLDGAPAADVFVAGYSEHGAQSFARTGADGSFTLKATAQDIWHLHAKLGRDGVFYRSGEQVVAVRDADVADVELVLAELDGIFLPDGASVSFPADEMRVLRLSDGVLVTIPASALAEGSGLVTVMALPKADLPTQSTLRPLGIGYALVAFDADNRQIVDFLADVTIVLPYPSDAVLTRLGIDEGDLVPSYYDETSGTWQPIADVVQDFERNTLTVTTDHFTDFAVVSAASATPTYTVYLAGMLR